VKQIHYSAFAFVVDYIIKKKKCILYSALPPFAAVADPTSSSCKQNLLWELEETSIVAIKNEGAAAWGSSRREIVKEDQVGILVPES